METNSDLIYSLRNRGSHLTRQRLLVLDILKKIPGHPDAEKIFQEARKRDDRISLATVYRSLALLKETGLVEENRLGEDHGHFETTHETHHYHFTCVGCGKVIEFEASKIPEVAQELSERENLQVTELYFHLQGYCPDCQKNTTQRGRLETTLSDLPTGETGAVRRLEGDKEFMNRVASLGFTIGARVTVLLNHGQGPMVVSLLGARIALGRQEADLIQVQPL